MTLADHGGRPIFFGVYMPSFEATARALLQLSAEYSALKDSIENNPGWGAGEQPRTLEAIETEYAATLKELTQRPE